MGAAEDGTQGLVQAMDHEYAKGTSPALQVLIGWGCFKFLP